MNFTAEQIAEETGVPLRTQLYIAKAGERRPRHGKGGRPLKLTRADGLGIKKKALKGRYSDYIKD